MDEKTTILLVKIGAIISLISGIACCFTVIGAILGIFLIMGYIKFKEIYQKPTNEAINDLAQRKYFGWAIFELIALFPYGLLIFVPYFVIENRTNNSSDKPTPPDNTNTKVDINEKKDHGVKISDND